MTPVDIAGGYDQLADFWNSGDFPRDNGIAQHARALAFLGHGQHALDIGCGSSGRVIDLLQRHGLTVEGLDISPRMIELARRRHPEVTFHHADICEWRPPRTYDFISAWDSFWHVPLSRQASVLRKILHALNQGGVCIFSTGGLDEPNEKIDACMGPSMYYGTLGIPGMLGLISDTGCVCRHLEYDQYPELHLYVVVQRAEASPAGLHDIQKRDRRIHGLGQHLEGEYDGDS
ncbi:trans-aconitate 2-methyltransferase [Nitrosovibrio sp. Nv17]|jgi:SAM-dependent methyltransferase|uniref:class I SAM-dependent methyltransferase n=1 Tax=Nitrosovibrio sp. Nv17 TaxID=1855339 RepID=UPI0009090C5D|nr:class I SAM-dependent methyltransferase [Nitrosovibrio sp. Nv17]SFW40740.1 Methyltransferase domain-containing protein [Nitrosovibrio sp. Nv17]